MVSNEADTVLLRQQARINLNILGELHPVKMEVTAHLDHGSLLQDFSFSFGISFLSYAGKG